MFILRKESFFNETKQFDNNNAKFLTRFHLVLWQSTNSFSQKKVKNFC